MQLKLVSLGLVAAFMTNVIAKPINNPGLDGTLQGFTTDDDKIVENAFYYGASGIPSKVIADLISKLHSGTGVAASNAAPAVQDTVQAIENNSGITGDVVRIIGASSGYTHRASYEDNKLERRSPIVNGLPVVGKILGSD